MAIDMNKGMRPNLYELLQGGGGGGGYVLPPATAATLGGIMVGDGLNVTHEGVLSAEGAGDLPERVTALEETVENLDETVIPALDSSVTANTSAINTLNNTTIPEISSRINTAQSTADGAAEQAEILAAETIPGINAQIHTINTRVSTMSDTTIPNIETWISEVESTVENIQLVDIPRIEDAENQNTAAIRTINTTTVPAINTRINDVEAALSSLLTVASMTLDDITVNAGTRKNNVFTSVAPEGYVIAGVKLINIQNATTGGTGRDKVFLSSWSTTGGSTSLQIAVYNSADTAAKIKIAVDVLCMKGA